VDVPVEPVLSAAEAAEHPQARARGLLHRGDDGLLRLAYPARIDGRRPTAGDRFPELGEDTDRLLEELGAEAAAMTPHQRRRAGVGRRFSLKRLLTARFLAKRSP
jgi:crotonobetainyl-CoA:carnitine CoA-transferase CaiB-like acyl-CoA transferase